MKKLFFAVFVLLSQVGFSQQLESAIITNPNHSDYDYKQLVRVFDTTTSVVMSCENGQYAFYLMQNGNISAKKVDVPTGYSVSDFCITEDKVVYFCGKNTNGYVGRFSFDAFDQQSSIDITANGMPNIDTLSKIKTYKDNAGSEYEHVVVLGEAGSYSVIFDFNNIAAYPNWECNVVATTSTTEKWKDIDFDSNYLVVAGLDGNSLYLHCFDKWNLTPVAEGYFTNPLGIAYSNERLFLKHLYDNLYVAVSEILLLPNNTYTYCQIIDFSSAPLIKFAYERTLMHPQKNIIRDIEYSKHDKELLVLMTTGGVGGFEVKDLVVYTPLDQGLSLPTQIKAVYFSYNGMYPHFNSVRIYKPYNYIVAGVEPIHNNMLLFAKDKTQETPTSCNQSDHINMSGSDVSTTATSINNLYTTSFSFSWNSPQITPTSDTLQVDCYN